jgi:hypothetical protein
MGDNADHILVSFVQREINSGVRHIAIPMTLVDAASDSALEAVRQLCKLNQVELSIGCNRR